MRPIVSFALCACCAVPGSAPAGGSDYGVKPGARAQIAGSAQEWPVPTPKFARDPAPGPDGAIYIAVMHGNRIARFDPASRSFREWELPAGARPHGLLVDEAGIVWYTGNGNGTIGRLDPGSGAIREFRAPSGGDPHTLVLARDGSIWFTVQSGQRIGRLDRATGKISEYRTSGNPYGIALDHAGKVWFCKFYGDAVARLDPASGAIEDIDTGAGTRPRRMATGPDGTIWVSAYGSGELLRLDAKAMRITKRYPMPAGRGGGPYAVTVDGAGRVWANEIDTDTVALFDPAAETFRVIALPSKGLGIRKAVIDAAGRYWYMGSHNGRLGVVE